MKNRSEGYLLEHSASILTTYLAAIVSCILESMDRCPPILRMALKQLRHRVEEKFPDNDTVSVRFLSVKLGWRSKCGFGPQARHKRQVIKRKRSRSFVQHHGPISWHCLCLYSP